MTLHFGLHKQWSCFFLTRAWVLFYFSATDEESFSDEHLIVNVFAMVLVGCAIVAMYILSRVDFKYHDRILVDCRDDL